ncbi:hypothetical protein NQ318_010987 [Aromia moschata]|uniref:Uncharacterized protein n=1 Tax=Aromia moschata TaxID=1265417 RepID=A0AAV8YMH2_9CUCU|nr:hypothetical protein NQ318_010987 [Aromia moschata]
MIIPLGVIALSHLAFYPLSGAKPTEKPNPYLNFFKRRPGREAIWRELPPLTLEDMNLSQKAAYITEAIARNFVDWIKTLGGDEDSYLTVEGGCGDVRNRISHKLCQIFKSRTEEYAFGTCSGCSSCHESRGE